MQTPKQKVRTSAEMFPLIEECEGSEIPQKEFYIDRFEGRKIDGITPAKIESCRGLARWGSPDA